MLNPLKSITFKTMSNDSNDMLSFDPINTESACVIFDFMKQYIYLVDNLKDQSHIYLSIFYLFIVSNNCV